jgi:hypothetical protein
MMKCFAQAGWILFAAIAINSIDVPAFADESTADESTDPPVNRSVPAPPPSLQPWLQSPPDVLQDIRRDPSFRTRVRLGYSQFAEDGAANGVQVGVEDVFVGETGLTVSGEYRGGDRQSYGGELRYYVRSLGSRINLSPVVGYRHLETSNHEVDGVNVGARVLLSLSRTGAADIALSQTWVAPGSSDETGLTTFSAGYAIAPDIRLSTEIQRQNAPQSKDTRFGVSLEWML